MDGQADHRNGSELFGWLIRCPFSEHPDTDPALALGIFTCGYEFIPYHGVTADAVENQLAVRAAQEVRAAMDGCPDEGVPCGGGINDAA